MAPFRACLLLHLPSSWLTTSRKYDEDVGPGANEFLPPPPPPSPLLPLTPSPSLSLHHRHRRPRSAEEGPGTTRCPSVGNYAVSCDAVRAGKVVKRERDYRPKSFKDDDGTSRQFEECAGKEAEVEVKRHSTERRRTTLLSRRRGTFCPDFVIIATFVKGHPTRCSGQPLLRILDYFLV